MDAQDGQIRVAAVENFLDPKLAETYTNRALILDFGIAKLTEETAQRLTQTAEIFGSPYYLFPEQVYLSTLRAMKDSVRFSEVEKEFRQVQQSMKGSTAQQ